MSTNPDRRNFLKYAATGVVGLAVGGAAGYMLGPAGAPGVPGAATTVTETRTLTQTVGGPAAEPILIGAACDINGYSGKQMIEGAQMAIDEVNASGGLLGRQLKLVTEDTREEQTGATAEDMVNAGNKLVLDDKVKFFIGGVSVPVPLMPPAADNKVIFFSTSGADMNMTRMIEEDYNRFKYCFQAFITNYDFGTLAGMFIVELAKYMGVKEVAMLSEDLDWTRFNHAYAQPYMEGHGLKIVGDFFTPVSATDYSDVLAKLEQTGAKIVYTCLSTSNTVPLMKKYEAIQSPFILAGYDVPAADIRWWDQTGGSCNYEIVFLPIIRSPYSGRTIPFYDGFKAKYGATPTVVGSQAYNGVWLYVDAVRRALSTDPDTLIPAIESTDMILPNGRDIFRPRGTLEPIEKAPLTHSINSAATLDLGMPVFFSQWQDGKLVDLWPGVGTDISLTKLAPWMK